MSESITPEELVERVEEASDKRFTRRVALITCIYALILAVCALGGSNAAKEMMMSQQQVANQWAHYQAKSIREHFYRVERLMIEARLLESGQGMNEAARAKYEETLRLVQDESSRFNQEKKEIEDRARHLEIHRDVSMKRDPYFDYGEVLLQLAIVLASVSILSSSRRVLAVSFLAGVLGAGLTINGFCLLVDIPFLN